MTGTMSKFQTQFFSTHAGVGNFVGMRNVGFLYTSLDGQLVVAKEPRRQAISLFPDFTPQE